MNFPYITLYDYVNFDCEMRNLFSTDPLDLYNFDSGCPDMYKYLNS